MSGSVSTSYSIEVVHLGFKYSYLLLITPYKCTLSVKLQEFQHVKHLRNQLLPIKHPDHNVC